MARPLGVRIIWAWVWVGLAAFILIPHVVARAQGPQPPQPPPPCEEQLNNEMLNKGGALQQLGFATQQLAVARAQLATMTKERDEAKAALAKAAQPAVTTTTTTPSSQPTATTPSAPTK